MEKFISNYSTELIEVLRNLSNNGPRKFGKYYFNLDNWYEANEDSITMKDDYQKCQKMFKEFNGPVLYWFTIVSDTSSLEIREKISHYKVADGLNNRATPSLRGKLEKDSKVLYVGKVKKDFWSRVRQHIGVFSNPKTQGLQLIHWSSGLGLHVELSAIEFEKGMSNLVSVFEWKFARDMKPIIGMH